MGIDYAKCDMCKERYVYCGHNYPIDVEGTDKAICPGCMEEWAEKKGIKVIIVEDEYGAELPMYINAEEYVIKKEYNPFKADDKIDKQAIKDAIKKARKNIEPMHNEKDEEILCATLNIIEKELDL